MNYAEHTAQLFKKRNGISKRNITYNDLLHVCRKNGYIVKYYSTSATIMVVLGVYDMAAGSAAVSAVDENKNVMIFIKDSLPEKKRLFALAHELGHIELEHKRHNDITAEKEADCFAHFLLAPSRGSLMLKLAAAACGAVAIISLLGIVYTVNGSIPHSKSSKAAYGFAASSYEAVSLSESTVCYFAEKGSVYHIYRDCSYLKNTSSVCSDTINHSHKSKICSRCNERYKNETENK